MISCVPIDQLPGVWSALQGPIEKALSKGQGDSTTPQLVYHELLEDRMQMWVIHDEDHYKACAIVSLFDGPTRKLIVEVLAGHNLKQWAADLNQVLADARDLLGAKCVEASCRPGLAEFLKGLGWKQKAVIMELLDG